MKWLVKRRAEVGDRRRRRRFAWLPKQMGEWWVWLEFYRATEEFQRYAGNDFVEYGAWIEIKAMPIFPEKDR